jgi:hypothetical protein
VKAVLLKRLLDVRALEGLLQAFSSSPELTIGIADAAAHWLVAHPSEPGDRSLVQQACDTRAEAMDQSGIALPLTVEDELYGAVYCDLVGVPHVRALRVALEMLIQQALVCKALASETLERYREMNLLYRINEAIGASLDLDEVIRRVLREGIRIIRASGGSVLLSDDLTDQLTAYDSYGIDVARAEKSLLNRALSEEVYRSGKPRILNDLHHHLRPDDEAEIQLVALLSAPLKANGHVLGVITLAQSQVGVMFTAGDEKLLTALASQAAVAIANAKEVAARESRLRQQIEALRIKIDEAKKQREVYAITENEYFAYLETNAERMRAEFDV